MYLKAETCMSHQEKSARRGGKSVAVAVDSGGGRGRHEAPNPNSNIIPKLNVKSKLSLKSKNSILLFLFFSFFSQPRRLLFSTIFSHPLRRRFHHSHNGLKGLELSNGSGSEAQSIFREIKIGSNFSSKDFRPNIEIRLCLQTLNINKVAIKL